MMTGGTSKTNPPAVGRFGHMSVSVKFTRQISLWTDKRVARRQRSRRGLRRQISIAISTKENMMNHVSGNAMNNAA